MVCRPSLATSRAADFHRNMVRGPPPAPSARKRLLRIISLAMRSREQSRLRDFSSGGWPRKPQLRPEAARHGNISRGIPRLRARVFALGRRDQVGTAPPSIVGNGQDLDSGGSRSRTWLGSDSPAQRKVSGRKITAVLVEERAALSCPHAEEPRLKRVHRASSTRCGAASRSMRATTPTHPWRRDPHGEVPAPSFETALRAPSG